MDGASSSPFFLGFDLSTQSLKAVLISEDSSVAHESAVHFDRDLPHHGTTNGAIRGPGIGEVTSPVHMWLEAFDLILERMKAAGVDFGRILAISGDGQQHGSVYWSLDAEKMLTTLDPSKPLDQLAPGAFSLPNAPIWQDSSTTRECRELEAAVGGAQALADLTGSRAYERFTGTQIAKIRRVSPEAYNATSRVSLVSSFMPSVFLGAIAPIEMHAEAPNCEPKLGPNRYREEACLAGSALTGLSDGVSIQACVDVDDLCDNPATVVALSTPGDAILSLGTSTTFLLSIPPADTPPKRFTTSHLLSHPTTLDAQIAMLCYKNGALAREQVRDRYANGDWTRFNELVEQTVVGNDGYLGFYFPLPEIIPPNVHGNFLFHVTPSATDVASVLEDTMPAAAHPRAILESQFLSIRARITAILPPDAPPLQRLVVCGGSSANPVIRQLAADVFGMRVFIAGQQGAAEGGAQLARYAWWRTQNGGVGTFEEMRATDPMGGRMKCVAEPRDANVAVYAGLIDAYQKCEDRVVMLCEAFA
ncbi:uncharacterized protein FIBRA_00607 [Fibroporia radiculosa]|uniref:Xylulose kinase n=1 Tax=Fibroporia radiculosa TaxID=599839 RepID=J4GI59_9APHY|nr:uncharacterized protein FIBRA_00607 [Fibroporia radiculosa]CCL98605.1 predicted protein [Fibroporia radiculosa]